ncbi:beta-galactosidase [Mucilaginibacter sp. CSA2-8R]|uniref:beta-galactosidase n=1 Tax=Mucilaginibacter sp. CSA2-8R TaxID=3141542 RepID=UPI00315CAC72
MNRAFWLAALICICIRVNAQEVYTADLSKTHEPVLTNHLKLGTHVDPSGHTLDANSLYFIKDGKPWYPVMGEFHFSRYARDQWEESILKMKAAGIDIIATYVFWIYHEEEEGKYNWAANQDLRAFAELCKKHQVSLLVRIGPWCHGEVRNGGFPDWLVKRVNLRKNNADYLASVQKFYNAIGNEVKGLYFKDGGPIVGVQIENEFRFNNPTGLEHILTLKQMAIKAGMDVPYYTATGWPGSNQTQNELIPVWGGYPEAPWDKRITELPLSENYVFSTLRNDPAIGSDLLGKHQEDTSGYKGYRYPYATAEMGGGIQITYHRRPIIEPIDVAALAYVKIGSGANLMGYYMFHGGSNAIGKLSTLQESKATKYPNDYPIISYDFQAPIGEFGQLRPSCRVFKVLHSFLNDFGDRLVQYYPTFAEQKPTGPADSTTLRFAVRSKDSSGFVFVSNYQRLLTLKNHPQVQFKFKLTDNQTLRFPEQPVALPSGATAIFPFNMDIDGTNLRYATVQPLFKLNGVMPTYVFFAVDGVRPELMFDSKNIKGLVSNQGKYTRKTDSYLINQLIPGLNCRLQVTSRNGKKINVLILTQQQALDSWKGKALGAEHLFISKQDLQFNKGELKMQSIDNPHFTIFAYPVIKGRKPSGKTNYTVAPQGMFNELTVNLPAVRYPVTYNPVNNIEPFLNRGALLPSDNRAEQANYNGPQYQTNLTAVDGSAYWQINLPNLSGKALLEIDYKGDTGSAYIGGKLIADDYYKGKPMFLNANKIGINSGLSKIIFQVIPFKGSASVYLQNQAKVFGGTNLSSVKLLPVYEAVIKYRRSFF